MRRETSQQYIVDLIAKIRAGIPGIALAHDFHRRFSGRDGRIFPNVAGFHSRDEIRAARRVHLFAAKKARAPARWKAKFPIRSRKKRRDLAMAAQHEDRARNFANHSSDAKSKCWCEGEATAEDVAEGECQFVGTWPDSRRQRRLAIEAPGKVTWLREAKRMRQTSMGVFISNAICRPANLRRSRSSAIQITI